MRLARAAAGVLVVGAGSILPFACVSTPVAGIGLVMNAPAGVLDDATSLTLQVFLAAGHTCNADGSFSPAADDAEEFSLDKGGCSGGATWCGEITLEQDDEERMFYVEARSSAGLLARGCATAVIDRDPVDVSITVVRFVEESCCGDGDLQPGELCDEGGDEQCGGTTETATCAADCLTKPVAVDANGEDVGQGNLAITFAQGDGQLSGGLRAAYEHSSALKDIAMRHLQADLSPVTEPAVLTDPTRIYLRCTGMTQVPLRDQTRPSIVAVGEGAALAYLSGEKAPGRIDAAVLNINADGCSDMQTALVASDESTSVQDVAIGAGAGRALVVWEQAGEVRARTFDGTALGAEVVITASGGSPSVAGNADGWVVAFAGAGTGDADGIFHVRVSAALDVDDPVRVNANTTGVQDQPAVAVLTDGSFAVAFRSADDVFFQRYDDAGVALADDQDAPLHADSAGAQASPVLAAGGSGNLLVAAWESGGEIRGRFADKDGGFLPNSLTGQTSDFVVTPSGGAPKGPAIAIADRIVFGWTNATAATPGIYVRPFPLPE